MSSRRLYRPFEISVYDRRIEIWYQLQRYLSCGIGEDGRFYLAINSAVESKIELDEILPVFLSPLDVTLTTYERSPDSMALPRLKTQEVTPGTPTKIRPLRAPKRPVPDSETVDHIDQHQREQVLDAILDSLIDNPEQTPKFRAGETQRIATIFSELPMAVAGVRAAYTRGAYGNPAQLLRSRVAQRRRIARARNNSTS